MTYKLMQSEMKSRNKTLLRQLTEDFPKDFSYADRVVKRLEKKHITVSRQMVYQTVSGNSYNQEIAWTIAVLYRGYRMQERKLNQALEALVA
jgi:hypothetical protein